MIGFNAMNDLFYNNIIENFTSLSRGSRGIPLIRLQFVARVWYISSFEIAKPL